MNLKKLIVLIFLGLLGVFIIFIFIMLFTLGGSIVLGKSLIEDNQYYRSPPLEFSKSDSLTVQLTAQVDSSNEFILHIPKIDLTKNVIPNVNPINESIYMDVIKQDVAHGKWTLTPNEVAEQNSGITYIFAHRAGEFAIFDQIDQLNKGDLVEIFYHGDIYLYQVETKRVVEKSHVQEYTSISDEPLLRIQTCENGQKQRLIIDSLLVQVV
ncbi:sortase [Candidatus Dojkabacteria bacterium]|nr:sortase [Candidatus Dojkabacteria bacterium]